MNYKDKTVLIMGTGTEVAHVERLSQDFKTCYYYVPWEKERKFVIHAYGLGFAPNIEKTYHPWDYLGKVDLIIFFDLGGPTKYLRKQGLRVIGGGDGEKFEEYRYKFRKIQESIGLTSHKTTVLKGRQALKEYISKNPEVVVKIDPFNRGDMETFSMKGFHSIDLDLLEIESAVGPFIEDFEFIVEEYLDSVVESGIDTFFAGDWVWPCWVGCQENFSYVGRLFDKKEMPCEIMEVMIKLTPLLKKVDYCGAISTKHRIMKDRTHYLTDMTMRFSDPTGLFYTHLLDNYSEVFWNVAEGKSVQAKYNSKYVGVLCILSPSGKDQWLEVNLPKEMKSVFKFASAAKVGDYFYHAKGTQIVGVLVCGGNSSKEVIETLKMDAKKIQIRDIDLNFESLDQISTAISKARTVGIEI